MERAGLASCLTKNGKSRSGKLFDKEWKEPVWQVVCLRMERAGLASCLTKNGNYGILMFKRNGILSVHGDNGIALLFGCLGAE